MAGRSVVYASGEEALFYLADKLKRHLDGEREAIREGEKHLTITIDLHDEPHPEGREGSDLGSVTGPTAGKVSVGEPDAYNVSCPDPCDETRLLQSLAGMEGATCMHCGAGYDEMMVTPLYADPDLPSYPVSEN